MDFNLISTLQVLVYSALLGTIVVMTFRGPFQRLFDDETRQRDTALAQYLTLNHDKGGSLLCLLGSWSPVSPYPSAYPL